MKLPFRQSVAVNMNPALSLNFFHNYTAHHVITDGHKFTHTLKCEDSSLI